MKCPESIEELEELERLLPLCRKSLFEQARARIETGAACSISEASRQIAEETGRSPESIRTRIREEQAGRGVHLSDLAETSKFKPKEVAITEDTFDEDESNYPDYVRDGCKYLHWNNSLDGWICLLCGEFSVDLDMMCDGCEYYVPESELESEKKPTAHVSHNSGENEWYTPPEIIKAVRGVMGEIDLDPASSDIANKIIQAKAYFTKDEDGLTKTWYGKIFLNPPYAQPLISQFSEKVCESINKNKITEAIVLVNNATETKWFQSMATIAKGICFPVKRIKFLDVEGNPAGAPLQGQAFLYFGPNLDKFIECFGSFGFVVIHV